MFVFLKNEKKDFSSVTLLFLGLDVNSKVVTDAVSIVAKSLNNNQTSKCVYAHQKTHKTVLENRLNNFSQIRRWKKTPIRPLN